MRNLMAVLIVLIVTIMAVQSSHATGAKRPTLDGKCHHSYIKTALKTQLQDTIKARVFAMAFPVLQTLYQDLEIDLTESDVLVFVKYNDTFDHLRIDLRVLPDDRAIPAVVNGRLKKHKINLKVEKTLAGAQVWNSVGDLIEYQCTREYAPHSQVFMLEFVNDVTGLGLIELPLDLLRGNLSERLVL